MSNPPISDDDLEKLTQLASILVPENAAMPRAGQIAGFAKLLRTAIKACGYSDSEIRAALDALQPGIDWAGAAVLAANRPQEFRVASLLVSAAYFMDPEVLARLGYPAERQHPAELAEFAEEYATGILDAVAARGPRYRDVR